MAGGVSARVSQGEKPSGLNNGPYCNARQRISAELLNELCGETGRRMNQAQPQAWRWRGDQLGKGEHLVQWACPQRPKWMDEAIYARMPETLRLRESRVGGWIIVSSLCDAAKTSKQDLLELYGWRWHSSVMAQAALSAALWPRQISFKGALQQLRAFERNLRHGRQSCISTAQRHLLQGVARLKLPHRPGRMEPRAVKRRGKNLPFLTQPRAVARARLLLLRQRQFHAATA